jgi:hypothetical protein
MRTGDLRLCCGGMKTGDLKALLYERRWNLKALLWGPNWGLRLYCRLN